MNAITVTNLGKAYKQYPKRWSRLVEWLTFGKKKHNKLNWVLQDISFTISQGESVGIIGINGAGKSTLLKMLVGTTIATTGTVDVSGRVAALLELGMGFHPEFTGRQNVYMAGQLLGYSADEIAQLLPEIEDFADIGEYIDQPVRVYSSGMQMRLAFSVATAKRPDVLIVDEALSVGDIQFQHKCFGKIRAYREQGTTLLIVSHDKQAIQSICDNAILLDKGKVAMRGKPETVMDYYNALLADQQGQSVKQETIENGYTQTVSGSGEATVIAISLVDEGGNSMEVVEVGESVILRIQVLVNTSLEQLVLGYAIKDRLGQVVFGTNTSHKENTLSALSSGSRYQYDIAFPVNLGAGVYSIATALTGSCTHIEKNYEWRDLAMFFTVMNTNKAHFDGLAWMDSDISVKLL